MESIKYILKIGDLYYCGLYRGMDVEFDKDINSAETFDNLEEIENLFNFEKYVNEKDEITDKMLDLNLPLTIETIVPLAFVQ